MGVGLGRFNVRLRKPHVSVFGLGGTVALASAILWGMNSLISIAYLLQVVVLWRFKRGRLVFPDTLCHALYGL